MSQGVKVVKRCLYACAAPYSLNLLPHLWLISKVPIQLHELIRPYSFIRQGRTLILSLPKPVSTSHFLRQDLSFHQPVPASRSKTSLQPVSLLVPQIIDESNDFYGTPANSEGRRLFPVRFIFVTSFFGGLIVAIRYHPSLQSALCFFSHTHVHVRFST